MSYMTMNPWPELFKALSSVRRQEYLSAQGYASRRRKCGRRGGRSMCAIYFLLFQLSRWALDGQVLAGSPRGLPETGTGLSGTGQTGERVQTTPGFGQMRNTPQRMGPQAALRDPSKDCSRARGRSYQKEQTD